MAYNFHQELVLINSQSVSGSSAVTITSGISSNFASYMLKVRDLTSSVSQGGLEVQFSTNGGSSYLSTNYKSGCIMNGTTSDFDTDTAAIFIDDDSTSTSTVIGNADVTFYNLTNTQVKVVYAFGGYYNSILGVVTTRNCAGVQTGTTAVNAIKIIPFAAFGGTFTGKFYFYGIQEP